MPARRTAPRGYANSNVLRKNPTPAERKLWSVLRNNQLMGVKFRRQHAVGRYVVDFCSIKKKLVIELDGSGHLESEDHDIERTKFLNQKGYRVIRFWNDQVMNDLESVISVIMDNLEK